MKQSTQLFGNLLVYAKQPKNNPQNLNFENYTITLVGDDYPGKTPSIWNAVYKTFHINAGSIMAVGSPEDIQDILKVLKEDQKYLGGGVGVGFKDEVIKYLDEIDPLAVAVGSVNVVRKTEDGKLIGYNTDGVGYAISLEELLQKKGKKLKSANITILGSGGTGNSVAFALAKKGANITILNRTKNKAEKLANKINTYVGKHSVSFGGEDQIIDKVKRSDVIVNVSTKGAVGELEEYSSLAVAKLPVVKESIEQNLREAEKVLKTISKNTIISDIVLRDDSTPLIKMAKKNGFEILDGIPMVINQGVEAIFIVHGEELKKKNVTKEEVFKVVKETLS